jgi:transposase-like protein
MRFSPEQKAQVARYAVESGNKRAIIRYSKLWGVDLKESTVRTWKAKYGEELRKRKGIDPTTIKELPSRKPTTPWRRVRY